jgi:hypothetical protein
MFGPCGASDLSAASRPENAGFLCFNMQNASCILAVRRHYFMKLSCSFGWKILGLTISVLSAAFGLFFSTFIFSEPMCNTTSTSALLTFGLFGFPTTLIPFAVGALMTWFGPGSWSAYGGIVHWVATIGMAMCYFIQWQYLAWKCFGRSTSAA